MMRDYSRLEPGDVVAVATSQSFMPATVLRTHKKVGVYDSHEVENDVTGTLYHLRRVDAEGLLISRLEKGSSWVREVTGLERCRTFRELRRG